MVPSGLLSQELGSLRPSPCAKGGRLKLLDESRPSFFHQTLILWSHYVSSPTVIGAARPSLHAVAGPGWLRVFRTYGERPAAQQLLEGR